MVLGHVRRLWSWAINSDEPYGITQSPAHLLRPKALIGERAVRARVLNDEEIVAFWQAATRMGYPAGDMFRLIMLTGTRISEASDAAWPEFNLKKRLWVIPSERFKSEQEHNIPRSEPAMALIEEIPRWNADKLCYFSTTGGKLPIDGFSKYKARLDEEMVLSLIKREPFVTHDLRRTVRTRLSELQVEGFGTRRDGDWARQARPR